MTHDNNALAQELEALEAKATKGPWSVFYYDAGDKTAWDNCPSIQAPEDEDCAVIHWDGFKQEHWVSANGDQRQIDANATLITLLRNNLPSILAALRTPAPVAGEVGEMVEAAYREGHQRGRIDGSWLEEAEDWSKSKARADMLERLAGPVQQPDVATIGMALCESALGGKRCPCRESGKFNCVDSFPGQQARAAIAAMRK